MQLAVDIGNTRIKIGVFNGSELVEFKHFQSLDGLIQYSLFTKHIIQSAIIGSVVDDFQSITEYIAGQCPLIIFSNTTAIPIMNRYKSASTLGSDRLAAAIGAYSISPDTNSLVIDAGTCIKYNFINSNNEYIGGAISPGISMRFKALNNFTAKLPLINFNETFTKLVGENTEESILSGVQLGSVMEINGFVLEYEKKYPGINIFLTGGDSRFLEKALKMSIFAEPYLVLKGLNEILLYNRNIHKGDS